MTRDNSVYFTHRAAEEMAAAKRAASAAAARVHRELSLRYSLKLILPERDTADDDACPIGQARGAAQSRPAPPPANSADDRRHG